MKAYKCLYFGLLALILGTVLTPVVGQERVTPEMNRDAEDPTLSRDHRTVRKAVRTQKYMAVAAHPLAAAAGKEILRRGGSAVDAAIAIQMVLGLVEPQYSGIGGGAFLTYYDAKRKQIRTYDGRETAPAAARSDRFLNADGKPLQLYDAVVGGKSVGVPGVVRMLEMVHKAHGKLPWRELFQPAIQLARQGFPISPLLYDRLSKEKYLPQIEPARSYFYQSNGTPKPVGTILVNRPYAEVLSRMANSGANAFYQGEIARDIANTVQKATVPGDLTTEDLATYQAKERSPVCGVYRVYKVCSMGPPSSGGLTVLQILGMLEKFPLSSLKPESTQAVHLFAEAGRLAYADRGLYMADADFVPVPVDELIDPEYLGDRAKLINPQRALTKAEPGVIPSKRSWGQDNSLEFPSTSHTTIVDRVGNTVSMTTSIEDTFGSRLMVRGFLLNNQLTDFSFSPTTPDGKAIANRVEPRKRPRSSMAPTMVFDRQGKLVMAVGSAGGARIINYVAQALIAVLDWKLDSQQALSLPHYGNRDGATELEANTSLVNLQQSLEAIGHSVQIVDQISGSHAITRTQQGLIGGADPRREGIATGE